MSKSSLDPSGPAQPGLEDAYAARDNPATKEPAERAQGEVNRASTSRITDARCANDVSTAAGNSTSTSLGYGVRGAPPGEEAKGYSQEELGRGQELDADQMAAPGEGDVYNAVEGGRRGKTGTGGVQPGLESDLDRKKEEQHAQREAIKESRWNC
ncbi:uncharacterized protein PV09_01494 [Verruconis gallopava]|uniref:Uncharacterized protein n=1 Tax=Verruconis gallopava TaxID=253628 RepID=A0A0D1Z3L8_9PEZI|nr:uncharacterized protein PV09_01494 [Verruconis gallopava]KIW07532.1 hypothetical protein PV09_01494 [Verruconis gallopava]